MMVKSFLNWMDQAGPSERSQAVDMLARAYLARALGGDSPAEVEAALTSILVDPSPQVRKTLALIFADRADAPRHIVLALAADLPLVGAILIARSPLLTEADLVDLAFAVEGVSLTAMAMRLGVPERVAQTIVGRKIYDSSLALVRNPDALIAPQDLCDLAEDFGDRRELREALLAREKLPAVARYILVTIVARRIGHFATSGGFLAGAKGQRVVDETVQTAVLAIGEKHPAEWPQMARHLRETAELTPALLLRSVLGGDLGLLIAALAELTGLELRRVESLMHARTDAAIAALFRRAELPGFLTRPLIAAIRAVGDAEKPSVSGFALPVIRAAQSACLDIAGEEGVRLLALLRRYEAEAARLESLRLAESLRQEARSELKHFTLRSDQVRQLEHHEGDEGGRAACRYEETGFKAGQVVDAPIFTEEEWGLRGTILLGSEATCFEQDLIESVPVTLEYAELPEAAPVRYEDDIGFEERMEDLDDGLLEARRSVVPELRQDEAKTAPSAVDLRALIAEWRKEREERDRAAGRPDETPAALAAPSIAANEPRNVFGRRFA
jgi:uncharacterized protein (DUF2336 family)